MSYIAIVLSLAILTLALLFPTVEGFSNVIGIDTPKLPNEGRSRRKLLKGVMPKKLQNKFALVNVYKKKSTPTISNILYNI